MSAVLAPGALPVGSGRGITDHAEAVLHLVALGFKASLRKCRVDASKELSTVAVYLAPADTRVRWTGGERPAPAGLNYRYDDRAGAVTVFSGFTEEDVAEFVSALATAPGRHLQLVGALEQPHAEWDPHGVCPQEAERIEAQMNRLSELSALGPDESLESRRLRRALTT